MLRKHEVVGSRPSISTKFLSLVSVVRFVDFAKNKTDMKMFLKNVFGL